MNTKTFPNFSKLIFFIPAIWLLVFFIIPLIFVLLYSFSEIENIINLKLTWTLDHYLEAFKDVYLKIIFKSVWMASLTTIISLVVGLVVALFIAFNTSPTLKKIFLLLVILPFWTNILIRTYALIAVLRGNGYVNKTYSFLWENIITPLQSMGFFEGTSFTPLELLYNNTAVVFGLVYVHLPFMILPIYGVLERLDKSYIEASFDLGAGRIVTLFKVVLPKITGGIYAGLLITFIPALGSFLTPKLLGGNDSQMIATVVERQFKGANNWPFGSALSLLMMYLLFFMVAIKAFYQNLKNRNR